ncbi:protein with putative role during mitosis [Puccinia graminis f. sp. tritici]|uniref:Protein with putative role during mitosis n=2 Tax=Puccinia graminis f. sp. tritici TaxID=56615 RepID=A0A5B0NJV0_PUCGR|nr:protein with putative role during mitosis [Puccinia graminis f. sp. tritici]
MPDRNKSPAGQNSTLSSTRSVVVKKYSCMYTTDLQKHRKVWHDGFIRMRHVNSKVYLISEDGHTLAESFIKISTSRAQPESNPDRLNYMKVHPKFSLDEDEQIEFDPVEDSELRPSSYMARIVDLVKVETENVPLLPPLNTKARQDLHKRKMEYLDQTIQQFSKRPKPGSSPQTSQLSDPITPSTPIPSASRRKMTGFEARPFNSPLINKSKQSNSFDTPAFERFRPPPLTKPITSHAPHLQSRSEPQIDDNQDNEDETQLIDEPDPKENYSPPLQPRPRNHPPPQPKAKPQKTDDPPRPKDPLIESSKLKNLPASSSSRVSDQKTLKVNWDSFFLAAKPP